MSEPTQGWTRGADGRRYPQAVEPGDDAGSEPIPLPVGALQELAELINSGVVAREIDRLVDDPELTA